LKSGYETALAMAREKLRAMDAQGVCARTGAGYIDGEYHVQWLGEARPLGSGSDVEQILWLHYLTSEGAGALAGRLCAFREFAGASFYEPKFAARALRPILKRFGRDPQVLYRAAEALYGARSTAGEIAVTLCPFPALPITYILWPGDDEAEASGQILFDASAIGWLSVEDLVVAASQVSYALLRAAK